MTDTTEAEGQEELFDLDDDSDVVDTDDGGAIVTLGEADDDPVHDHFVNLAETLPENELHTLALDLLELIDKDKESRKKRDEQYEEGIRRTGLGNDAPGGAQFEGASKVVHPMMTEACIDFSSRVMKEIFPPDGPVKDKIIGEATQEKLDKAIRKTRHMNWQLTEQMPNLRDDLEQGVTQTPLGGAFYLKIYWDDEFKVVDSRPYMIDQVLLPYSASSFYSAHRKTLMDDVTDYEFTSRVRSGLYRDIDATPSVMEPDKTASAKASDRVEGKGTTQYNEDGLRRLYETSAHLEVSADDGSDKQFLPYLVTIDEVSRRVVGLYRNWDPEDETAKELDHVVEFPFIPWRGAYPLGLPHMIGGLSATATGAMRALLDSAHINNFPGAIKLKGSTSGGQTKRVSPTEITEMEGSVSTDDIRKVAMPFPFNPPSTVLYQLLGFVVDASRGVVRTTMEEMPEIGPNTPVGTTMAVYEQGMTVFSAIHARMHKAMARVLRIVHRINSVYLDEEEIVDDTGEVLALKSDYDGPMDVVPVSDPRIFSEMQRYIQMQTVAARAQQNPMYNQFEVERRILERMKIPDYEELLNEPQKPHEMNAVNENLAAVMGRPITSFPDQDHLAHLQVHLDFMTSPMFGFSRLMAIPYIPTMLGHIREHLSMWYVSEFHKMVSEASGVSAEELMGGDPEISREFDALLATVSPIVVGDAQMTFAKIPPVVEQAMQIMEQMAPQQQTMDPAQAHVATEQMKSEAKARSDEMRAQVDSAKLADRGQDRALKEKLSAEELSAEQARAEQLAQDKREFHADQMELELEKQDREDERTRYQTDARVDMNESDNETARDLAEMEIEHGNKIAVSTGTGINPNPGGR